MPTLAMRFPAGTEYWLTETTPKVGEVLTRDGDEWIVVEVSKDRGGNTLIKLEAHNGTLKPA